MTRLAVVFFPDWETGALAIDCPPGAPAALVSAAGRITHVTREARAMGVAAGMRRALAEHLCDGLLVMPSDPGRSLRAFNVVLDALGEVSATVCMVKPGIAWIPASASRTFGSEEALCERVVDVIAEQTGSECYVGIGEGLLQAWVGALHGVVDPDESRVSDLSLRHLKPLMSQKESDLDQVLDSLAALGARTVGDLQALGAGHVLARFGEVGQSLYRLLWQVDALHKAERAPEDFVEQTVVFPTPVADLGVALGYLLEQSGSLVEKLVAKQMATNEVDITATILGAMGRVERSRRWAIIDFPAPRDLVDRTRWQIQSWIDELARSGASMEGEYSQERFGVEKIVLTARDLVSIDSLAKQLWADRSEGDVCAGTVAFRLQALVGLDGVLQPRVRPGFDPLSRVVQTEWGAAPETAAWEQWSVPQKWQNHASFQDAWVGGLKEESPATVLEKPLPARLFDEGGRAVKLRPDGTLNATPRSMVVNAEEVAELDVGLCAAKEVVLSDVRGPWPILGRWWDGQDEVSAPRAWLVAVPLGAPRVLIKWGSGEWMLAALWY